MLVPDKHFHSCPVIAGKAGAYPRVELSKGRLWLGVVFFEQLNPLGLPCSSLFLKGNIKIVKSVKFFEKSCF